MADPRAFVECTAWEWRHGMATIYGERVVCRTSTGKIVIASHGSYQERDAMPSGSLPDLTDTATLGAVEHSILAPAGVWVERVWYHSSGLHYKARTDWRYSVGCEHPTLADALLDGLRVVKS